MEYKQKLLVYNTQIIINFVVLLLVVIQKWRSDHVVRAMVQMLVPPLFLCQVKEPCSSYNPSRSRRCRNITSTHVPSNQAPSSTVTLSATCPAASPDPVSPWPNQQARDGPLLSSLFSLPSLLSISCVHVFMLQHVPKGARDTWSGLVTTELNSNSWCKFMMLAK